MMFAASKRKRPTRPIFTKRDDSGSEDEKETNKQTTNHAIDTDQTVAEKVCVKNGDTQEAKLQKKRVKLKARASASLKGLSFAEEAENDFGLDYSSLSMKDDEKKRKIKSQGGMGFGGFTPMFDQGIQEDKYAAEGTSHFSLKDADWNEIDKGSTSAAPSGTYSKEHLKQLKAAQAKMVFHKPSPSEDNVPEIKAKSLEEEIDVILTNKEKEKSEPKEQELPPSEKLPAKKAMERRTEFSSGDDFVSFNPQKQNLYKFNILTGDEALLLVEKPKRNSSKKEVLVVDDTVYDEDDEIAVMPLSQEEDEWESRIASRGIRIAKGASAPAPSAYPAPLPSLADESMLECSIKEVKLSMVKLVEKFRASKSDSVKLLERKQSERDSLNEKIDFERTKLSSSLKDEFNFYQQLRLDVANWVGALRSIDEKLNMVESVLLEIGKERNFESQTWNDLTTQDSMETLKEAGILDGVAGFIKEKPLSTIVGGSIVDEFGRDVSNAEHRERAERWNLRRQLVKTFFGLKQPVDGLNVPATMTLDAHQKPNVTFNSEVSFLAASRYFGQEACVDLNPDTRTALQQRLDALQEAVNIVMDEISEQYHSIVALILLFHRWAEAFPHDYKLLGPLALPSLCGVLVRVEFVEKVWIPLLTPGQPAVIAPGMDQFKWYNELVSLYPTLGKQEVDTSLELIYRHCLLPLLAKVIKHANDPVSEFGASLISSLARALTDKLVGSTELLVLNNDVVSILRGYVASIGVPAIKSIESVASQIDGSISDLYLSQLFAMSQIFRLERMVSNICKYWMPLIEYSNSQALSTSIERVLLRDIVKERFLPSIIRKNIPVFAKPIHEKLLTTTLHIIEGCNSLKLNEDNISTILAMRQAIPRLE